MKKLSFLFSVFAVIMMAQSMEAIADDNCTDVTVTYVAAPSDPSGGKPSTGREIAAWHVTQCNRDIEDYYVNFKAPSQTLSFKNTVNKETKEIEIAPPGMEHGLPITLAGYPIQVVCTCYRGICGNCAEVSQPIKKKVKSK